MKRKTTVIISLAVIAVFALLSFFVVNSLKKSFYPREYQETVARYSAEFNVPEPLIYAIIKCESDFRPEVVSSAGATGLMQLMPETFDWLAGLCGDGEPIGEITDPDANIKYGTFYLSYLYERFENWDTVLAAYNAGHGRVANWLKDSRYSENGVTLKNIPISETENYVNKVNKSQEQYQKLYYKGE
ncbi:MAG: lytic transglycosylase domain-containing protein [Clostridia bacterium]|nr:lytic transglycosylase domain-containing protein [Clostridia bacterium]